MGIYYAASTNWFYDYPEINHFIPDDSVEISAETRDDLINQQRAGKIITHDENGYPIAVDPPPPTPDRIRSMAVGLAVKAMDMLARSWSDYDDIGRAISCYWNSSNPQWQAEARALGPWFDSVWEWEGAKWAAIEAGTIPCPATPEEYIQDMPVSPPRPDPGSEYQQPDENGITVEVDPE